MEHHEPEHEPVAPAPAPAAAELPSPEVAPAFGGPVSAAGGAWLNGAAQLGPTGRAATVARLQRAAGMAAWVRAQAAAQARRDAVMAAIGRLEEQLAGGQALGRGLQPALRFPFDQPPADDDAEICEPLPEPRQSTLR